MQDEILNNFSPIQESMRQEKKKGDGGQKRYIILSSRVIQKEEGLYLAIFCNKSLDHPVFLKITLFQHKIMSYQRFQKIQVVLYFDDVTIRTRIASQ